MNRIKNGTITLGLSQIPVELICANPPSDVYLKIIHKKCNMPVMQKWCNTCDSRIKLNELAKIVKTRNVSYSYEEAIFEKEDIGLIEIVEFVNRCQIEPQYYGKHYYLIPENVHNDSFFLFLELLSNLNKIALSKINISTNTFNCAIHAYESGILLTTLHVLHEPDIFCAYKSDQSVKQLTISF